MSLRDTGVSVVECRLPMASHRRLAPPAARHMPCVVTALASGVQTMSAAAASVAAEPDQTDSDSAWAERRHHVALCEPPAALQRRTTANTHRQNTQQICIVHSQTNDKPRNIYQRDCK